MTLQMFEEKSAGGVSRVAAVVAVASGKGGVGKSTVAAGMALAAQKAGLRVGVLDADIYGPSMGLLLKGRGIPAISMADERAHALRAPIANRLIGQFVHKVEWGELDLLIVDFPPGTGDVQITLCQELDISGALLVGLSSELALLDLRKALSLFDQMKVPVAGVVENMSPLFGEGGVAALAEERGIEFLGSLPFERKLVAGELDPSLFGPLVGRVLGALEGSTKRVELEWESRHTFLLDWEGERVRYRLSDLQARCPCATCLGAGQSEVEVEAHRVEAVGRYGLRFTFSSGCSAGIYDFEMLRCLNGS